MTPAFASLVAAAIAWVAVHIGVSGTRLRDRIVARVGERPFRGLFVLVSFARPGRCGCCGTRRAVWWWR